jgi:uncharacterized protein (UPF0303 family)
MRKKKKKIKRFFFSSYKFHKTEKKTDQQLFEKKMPAVIELGLKNISHDALIE